MPCPQRQILQHSQVWKNTPTFKDVSDAQTCPHVRWSGLETRSVEANFACLGGEQTADSVDDRAFAGPVGAEQRHAFPGGNRERYAPDHLVVAVGDFEIANLKQHR